MGILGFTEDGAAFEDVIPQHDNTRRYEFCNHIMDVQEIDKRPHEQLIQSEPRDTRAEKEHLCAVCLRSCAAKDADEAQPIVEKDGDGEGDPGGDEVVDTQMRRENVEESVVEEKTRTADEDEAGDFVESG